MSIGNSDISQLSQTKVPSIEKLYGGRYRVSRYFISLDKDKTFEDEIEDNYFDSFGASDGAAKAGIEDCQEDGQAFQNCKLISQEITYFPNDPLNRPILVKVYETLTDTLALEKEPQHQYPDDGGHLLTEQWVGTSAANFVGTVGVTTHPDDPSLVLSGINVTEVNGKKTITLTWATPVLLSHARKNVGEGLFQHTYTWRYVEGTMAGIIASRRVNNPEGARIIEVGTLSNSDDESPVGAGGSPLLASRRKVETQFTLPGVVDIVVIPSRTRVGYNHKNTSPVETKVLSDILVYYQSSGDVQSSDYLLDGAKGAWNPKEGARAAAIIYHDFVPYYMSQSMRGYRCKSYVTFSGIPQTISAVDGDQYKDTVNLSLDHEEPPAFAFGVESYLYDTLTVTYGGGVVVSGKDVVRQAQWRIIKVGDDWEFQRRDVLISEVLNLDSGMGVTDVYSQRAGTSTPSYSTPTDTAWSTLTTSSDGNVPPSDASWTEGAVSQPRTGESYSPEPGNFINGRRIQFNAEGALIEVEGGPENPLGNRYVLNVDIQKAFEDVDGNVIHQKVVQVATINPI